MRIAVGVSLVIVLASRARADEVPPVDPAPPPIEQPPPEPPPPPPPPAPEARDDAGWQLYDQAFAALASGDRARAAVLIRQLTSEHAGHPALAEAAPLIALLDPPPGETPAGEPPPARPSDPETLRQSARAELAVFQTIHGVLAGVELCLLAGCDDPVPVFGLALLGGGLGLGISLAGTPDGITDGARALANSGTFWGLANAGLWTALAEPENEEAIFGALLGGQLVGLLFGSGIGRLETPPRAGQVALANSGGTWLAALTGLVAYAAVDDLDDKEVATTLLVAMDAGLIAGGYLASRMPRISRSQTLVYDAGGILGGVAGGGAYMLITNEVGRGAAACAAAGAVVGLGAAAYLTRHWNVDTDAGPAHAGLIPTEDGAIATLSVALD